MRPLTPTPEVCPVCRDDSAACSLERQAQTYEFRAWIDRRNDRERPPHFDPDTVLCVTSPRWYPRACWA
jgi:hypothetical protein